MKKIELARSDYFYSAINFIALLVIPPLCISVLLYNTIMISYILTIVVSIVLFCCGFFIAAYIYLNATIFYEDFIAIKYFIKRKNKREIYISYKDVVSLHYKYIGGKGSGGTGTLYVYYKENGFDRTIKCSLLKDDGLKLCEKMQKKNIKVKLDI